MGERSGKVLHAKGLRIGTRCDSIEQFIAKFQRFCEDGAVFVPHATRQIGTETAFSFDLNSGEPALCGLGTVLEQFTTTDNRFGRPGVIIGISRLQSSSKHIYDDILIARAVAAGAGPAAALPVDRAVSLESLAAAASDRATPTPWVKTRAMTGAVEIIDSVALKAAALPAPPQRRSAPLAAVRINTPAPFPKLADGSTSLREQGIAQASETPIAGAPPAAAEPSPPAEPPQAAEPLTNADTPPPAPELAPSSTHVPSLGSAPDSAVTPVGPPAVEVRAFETRAVDGSSPPLATRESRTLDRRTRWQRRLPVAVAIVAFAVAGVLVLVGTRPKDTSPPARHPGSGTSGSPATIAPPVQAADPATPAPAAGSDVASLSGVVAPPTNEPKPSPAVTTPTQPAKVAKKKMSKATKPIRKKALKRPAPKKPIKRRAKQCSSLDCM